ncbi:MAG TPA: nucleotidyl transferase AbiEii/AbiGii toxin family protein [Candidatus Acidoferrales bacterium]|nr:nucleotidyl transferase AbiEii/AbiGii toxin family protein [Candidatus Acidoferrales bacterium]
MDKGFYFNVLYPLQDRVLGVLTGAGTDFYLTGGTAASRGYLHHRFSDDLDLFVNDDARFVLWTQRVVDALSRAAQWQLDMLQKEERFVRLNVTEADVSLKIELVNDVPAHLGEVRRDPVLGRLDSPENILANKLSALADREEPKDLADVWGFCCRLALPVAPALQGAPSKAAGLFPADLARILLNATRTDWELVRWIDAPQVQDFLANLHALGESLLLVRTRNSE